MKSFTKPVESTAEPRKSHIRKNATDWDGIAEELKKHPNQWRLLDIKKYIECPYARAKYAGGRLRKRGLSVDYHQHYEEHHNVPDPDNAGQFITVRHLLDTYSVHIMFVAPEPAEPAVEAAA